MKKLKPRWGIIIIILFVVLTIAIWFYVRKGSQTFSNYSVSTHSLGQLSGLVGMTLFSLTFVLTTRLKLVEKLFGGLDKVYITHHTMGIVAFILLLFHPLLLVIKFIPSNIKQAAIYLLPSNSWAVNYGMIALAIMTLLIILTLYINLKYPNWKLSHKFMGLVFIIACFHVFFITTDITFYPLLRNYMVFVSTIGLVSYLYGSYFRHYIENTYSYEIDSVETKEKITTLTLKPKNKILEYIPGQFIFIRFFGNNIPKEQHPFSIASAPVDGKIKLSIKSIGDYTDKVKELKPGTVAEIEGPYGFFNRVSCDNDQIWISGGIGITPFLSMVESLKQSKSCKIDLYYCLRNKSEAVFLDRLETISNNNKDLRIIPYYSDEKGFLTVDKIEKISKDIKTKDFFLCGPPAMMKSITIQLKKIGIKNKNIHKEDFNLR